MAGFEHTTIVGVGLIGGSLGLALKARGLAAEVVGVGHRESTLSKAQKRGAIDRWTLDAAEGAAGADLVVLCTPVGLVAQKAAEVLPAMKAGGILTDVASTKSALTERIEAVLPDDIAFVPAHPMAGSEKRGIENARADLFEGSRCILTPTPRTPVEAVGVVCEMWRGVGAAVERLDIAEHDRIVAQISHLPHVVASALVNSAKEGLPYAATGFRDTTRIAGGDPELWIDIFRDNRENVLAALGLFLREVEEACKALENSDWDTLRGLLERARERRNKLDSPGSDGE